MFRLIFGAFSLVLWSSFVYDDAYASRALPAVVEGLQGDLLEADDAALAPLSFVRFCIDHKRECEPGGAPGEVIELTAASLESLDLINRSVNRRIRPVAKPYVGGLGQWAVNPSAGDCNDYAVSKRHELIKKGFPVSALLLAVARTSWGEGHLLLIARTDRGDLVLDNLQTAIRPWNRTDYSWIKRQSPVDPMRWEAIATGAHSARVAAAIEKSRALAEARAEKRREARRLLAQARSDDREEAPALPGVRAMAVHAAKVALGYDALPAWASPARRYKMAEVADGFSPVPNIVGSFSLETSMDPMAEEVWASPPKAFDIALVATVEAVGQTVRWRYGASAQ